MTEDKFRLITRSDFDGLVCAVLLKELDLINEIKFVHPKDVQDGLIDIRQGDIITNLPYSKSAFYVFDHHISEWARIGKKSNCYINPQAPSAARIIWDTFGGKDRFKNIPLEMMAAVDKADRGDFSLDEILNPKKWDLINFIIDPRTGLGKNHHFKTSNYQMMMNLIDLCRTHDPDEIIKTPDIKERVDVYFSHQDKFMEQLKNLTVVHKNLAYIDTLNEDILYTGNRFIIYTLFPDINVSMHAAWRINGQKITFAIGKSILNRSNIINIGELLLQYGGGGHFNVGACQTDLDHAGIIKEELINILTDPQYTEKPDQNDTLKAQDAVVKASE